MAVDIPPAGETFSGLHSTSATVYRSLKRIPDDSVYRAMSRPALNVLEIGRYSYGLNALLDIACTLLAYVLSQYETPLAFATISRASSKKKRMLFNPNKEESIT